MKGIAEIFEGKDSSLYKTYEKATNTSERAELIKQFCEIINREREKTKWKPITGRALAIKLSHISTTDLYHVLSMGKDYKNRNGSFSKFLFGSIKPKK